MSTRFLRLALLAHLAATPALAIDADEMFDDPALETRAREIGRELRCLVCQNQSIFDSNAELAKDLRIVVRERMIAGDSDDEVLDYISGRFGDYVLLKPPVSGQTMALWLAPVGFLLAGLGGVIAFMRGRQRPGTSVPDLTDAERDEARRLLQGEDS